MTAGELANALEWGSDDRLFLDNHIPDWEMLDVAEFGNVLPNVMNSLLAEAEAIQRLMKELGR